jgi:hypothetical protein
MARVEIPVKIAVTYSARALSEASLLDCAHQLAGSTA